MVGGFRSKTRPVGRPARGPWPTTMPIDLDQSTERQLTFPGVHDRHHSCHVHFYRPRHSAVSKLVDIDDDAHRGFVLGDARS